MQSSFPSGFFNRLTLMAWLPVLLVPLFSPFLEPLDVSIGLFPGLTLDKQRALEIYAMSISAVCLMATLFARHVELRMPDFGQVGCWLIFFALGLVSCGLAEISVRMALLEWSWFLLLVLITYGLARIQVYEELKQLACLIVFVSTSSYVAVFFLSLGGYYFDSTIPFDSRAGIFGFSNIRYFSDYQTGLLLMAPTALASFSLGRGYRPVARLLVALFFSLSFVAGSRSIFLAHAMIHLIGFVVLGRRHWSFFREQAMYWIAGGCLFVVLFNWLIIDNQPGPSVSALQAGILRLDSSGRTKLWSWALEMIAAHPWFGVGPMNFAGFANVIAAHPHNLPLQILAEWGLVAGIAGLAAFGLIISGHIRSLRANMDVRGKPKSPLLTAAIFAAWAILIQSLVTNSTGYPVSQVQLMTCLALASVLQPLTNPSANERTVLRVQALYAGMTLLALSVALMILVPQIETVEARNRCYQENLRSAPLFAPRFWYQGWIVGPCRVS